MTSPLEFPRQTQVVLGASRLQLKVMMNLVTGVFVDGAQRIAREEKNQDLPGAGTPLGSSASETLGTGRPRLPLGSSASWLSPWGH